MARVEVNPDWQALVMPAWVNFAESRLGPDIADDARKYCPVDTGALKASIRDEMEGTDLIVSATGGGEDRDGNMYVFHRPGTISATYGTHSGIADPAHHRGSGSTREIHHIEEPGDETGHPYATFVELGHAKFHPSTRTVGPGRVQAVPFLRPALYTRRGE